MASNGNGGGMKSQGSGGSGGGGGKMIGQIITPYSNCIVPYKKGKK